MIADDIAAVYANAAHASNEDIDRIKQVVDGAGKSDLQEALTRMGFVFYASDSRSKLAQEVMKWIISRNGSYKRANLNRNPFEGKAMSLALSLLRREADRRDPKLAAVLGVLKTCQLGMEDEIKEIAYAYPSSPDASKFGLHDGGYVVSIGKRGRPLKAISGHKTKEDADAAANKLPQEYGPYSLSLSIGTPQYNQVWRWAKALGLREGVPAGQLVQAACRLAMDAGDAYDAGYRYGKKIGGGSVVDPARLIHGASAEYISKLSVNLQDKLAAQRDFKEGAKVGFQEESGYQLP